jgi:hypothetical protein
MFNTRLTGTDVLVTETIDLSSGALVDIEPINGALGDTDTALLESGVLVMPVLNVALGIDPTNSRFDYGLFGFTAYQGPPLDTVGGLDEFGDHPTLSFDPVHPGAAVYGSVTPSSSWLLFQDNPASVLKVDRDAAAYAADQAQGLMMVHFQNKEADKVQVVALNKFASTTALALNPTSVTVGSSSTATVTVTGGAAGTPTGSVTLKDGSTTVGTTAVNGSGVATFTVTPTTAGTHSLTATYAGDSNYAGGSATGTLTVLTVTPPTKVTPTVSLSLDKESVKRHHKVKASVSVSGSAGTATGTVQLGKIVDGDFHVVATGTLSNGTVTLKYSPSKRGRYKLQVRYSGSTAYNAALSAVVKLRVTK